MLVYGMGCLHTEYGVRIWDGVLVFKHHPVYQDPIQYTNMAMLYTHAMGNQP